MGKPGRKAKFLEGVRKDIQNIVQNKQALRSFTVEQSRKINQSEPDRIVHSKLVLVEKVDESGSELL